MGKLLIQILLIVLCSLIAFVLGAIVNSGVRRNKKKGKLLKETDQHVPYLVCK